MIKTGTFFTKMELILQLVIESVLMLMFYLSTVKDVEFGNKKGTDLNMKNGKLRISAIKTMKNLQDH